MNLEDFHVYSGETSNYEYPALIFKPAEFEYNRTAGDLSEVRTQDVEVRINGNNYEEADALMYAIQRSSGLRRILRDRYGMLAQRSTAADYEDNGTNGVIMTSTFTCVSPTIDNPAL